MSRQEQGASGGGPATQLQVTGATLDLAAVADGEYLIRVGSTVVGAAGSGGAASQLDANGTTLDVDAIADGQLLVRTGTAVVGVAISGTGAPVGTGRTLTAGAGLTGGGDLSADRSFALDQAFTPTWTAAHTWTTSTNPIVITQGAAAAGAPTALRINAGAHTVAPGATSLNDVFFNTTRTWTVGAASNIARSIEIGSPTYSGSGAGPFIAYSLYVGAPVIVGIGTPSVWSIGTDGGISVGGAVSVGGRITSPDGSAGAPTYSFGSFLTAGMYCTAGSLNFSSNGVVRIAIAAAGGDVTIVPPIEAPNGTAGSPSWRFSSDSNTGPYRVAADQYGISTGGVLKLMIGTTAHTLAQTVATTGSPVMWTATAAAHTALTASVEASDIVYALARTVQFSTGALATQRAFVISNPTYAFVGASTLTDAATLAVVGAPVAGTNATLTNSYAFWVQAGMTRMDGSLRLTNTISPAQLTANQNNYAPTGFADCYLVRQDVDATGRTITGLAGGASGRVVVIANINAGATNIITLTNEDGASTAGNRFLLPNATSVLIRPQGCVILIYDSTSSRWRVAGNAA